MPSRVRVGGLHVPKDRVWTRVRLLVRGPVVSQIELRVERAIRPARNVLLRWIAGRWPYA